MTSRSYCITSFNLEAYKFDEAPEGVRYMIYSIEECPDTKKLHVQGYIELNKPMRFTGLKKLFNDNTMHCKERKGTRDQARNYCMKLDTHIEGPFEYGEWKAGGQGSRNDIKKVCDKIIKNEPVKKIALEHPVEYIKYHRGFEKLEQIVKENQYIDERESFRKIKVHIIWGDAGTGKTRHIIDKHGKNVYKLDIIGDKIWWDGYHGQKILLLDDYYGEIPFAYLLKILDGYPIRLDIKGSHTYANWTKIYITSNKKPKLWYGNMLPEFKRRIDKVTKLSYEVGGVILGPPTKKISYPKLQTSISIS